MSANRWLSAEAARAGAPLTPETVNCANRVASEAAGREAHAQREQARLEHAEQTELELKKLRAVLRSLRGVEREARRWAKPSNLKEAIEFPPSCCEHWPLLRQLESASEAFESAFQASRPEKAPRRGRGERASGDERAASNRYVTAFFESAIGRDGTPREFAITEIALGRSPRCVDASEFDERRKRWSKAKRRPK